MPHRRGARTPCKYHLGKKIFHCYTNKLKHVKSSQNRHPGIIAHLSLCFLAWQILPSHS